MHVVGTCMYVNLLARMLLADRDVLGFSHWLLMKQAQEGVVLQLFQVSIVTWLFSHGLCFTLIAVAQFAGFPECRQLIWQLPDPSLSSLIKSWLKLFLGVISLVLASNYISPI